MTRRKEQIESFIAKAVRTAKSDRELSIKGLNFGRWWNEVGEYDKASEWITRYLGVFDKDGKAHKLLGEIYEKLDQSDAALACYKNSLRVRPQQFELMLKVAEMHINPGPSQNPNRAQVWLEKAAIALPNNPQVYKLKMELLLAQEAPTSKLEEVITDELRKRPNDPTLYSEYVNFLKDKERYAEAFAFVRKTAQDVTLPKIVEKDMEWNQCLTETCQEYAEQMSGDQVTSEGIKAYSLLMITLCRYVWICLEEEKYDDAIQRLALLDQTVLEGIQLNHDAEGVDEWSCVLNEAKGQIYWLSAVVLIHQATQKNIPWKEATKLAASCFSASLSYPMADTTATWSSWSKDTSFPERLKLMGGLRLSQSAHMIYNLASVSHSDHKEEDKVNEAEWIREVTDNYCTNEGQRKVFDLLFGESCKSESSMIYNDPDFGNATVQLINEDVLLGYDCVVGDQADLQTWIWMGLQWKQNFDNTFDPYPWISSVFSELQLAPSSSLSVNIWNLFLLDVEAFVVACILYAEKAASLWRDTKRTDDTSLALSRMPLPLCRKLTTERQTNWWDAACKLHNKRNREKIFNSNEVRATLRHGIESFRGFGNHGLQLMLVAGLAKHFAAKAFAIDKSGMGTSSAAWLAYQRRSAHYWTIALPSLQNIIRNRSPHQNEPKDRLFPNTLNDPTIEEAKSLISEVYMCTGSLLVQEGDLKRALETYGKADTPHASICEALIYKQLIENCEKEGSITGSHTKKKEALSRKYTARLEVTLNRLQRDPDDEILRRTESLLHAQMSPAINRTIHAEAEPKRLFEETIPRQLPYVANHTVNSEVDDSVLPVIPSKQSTPKSEMRSAEYSNTDGGNIVQLAQNVATLTSTLSTFQLQFNERLNQMEKDKSPKVDTEEITDKQTIRTLTEQQKQMQQKIEELQDQLNRTQLGTPVAPGRVVQLTQPDKVVTPTPIQLFDQYQQGGLRQMGSPAPAGSRYYGYVQNQAIAALNAQQGILMSPNTVRYQQQGFVPSPAHTPPIHQQQHLSNVMQQQVFGPSPVHTPPLYQQQPLSSNTGLAISQEGFGELSIRLQTSFPRGVTPTDQARPTSGQSPLLVSSLTAQSLRQQTYQAGAVRTPSSYDQTQPGGYASSLGVASFNGTHGATILERQPLGPSLSQPVISGQYGEEHRLLEGQLGMAQSETAISKGHNGYDMGSYLGMQQNLTQSDYQSQVGNIAQRQQLNLNQNYLPPSVTNTVQTCDGSVNLDTLLTTGYGDSQVSQQPGINYPTHIQFPDQRKDQSGPSPGWNFKFHTPEEMDQANQKLEAEEEAEEHETSQHDTGPHFEPLVNLPEVEVRTGEEEENVMFSERAKLFRWHEGQWKERGVGEMKILKHNKTGKHRLLMRRDQVLKICCNHLIGKDLDLKPMPRSDKAWVWHAMDFSDEEGSQEGFAIRFKTVELANDFRKKFLEGKEENMKVGGGTPVRPTPKQSESTHSMTASRTRDVAPATEPKPSVSETALPKIKFSFPKPSAAALDLAAKISGNQAQQMVEAKQQETVKDDDNQDESVHNESGDGPHFEPVIKLPDRVSVVTGEENEEVLFCQRVKLYRYHDKQWKERGVGDMKILHNKANNKCRIVMRREQVLKLCANHYITPEMKISRHGNQDKSLTWTALDHSDPDVPPRLELLATRFKDVETAVKFREVFNQTKDIIQGKVSPSSTATEISASSAGIFKPLTPSTSTTTSPSVQQKIQSPEIDSTSKGTLVAEKIAGSWDCPACYSPNLASDTKCPCCGTPNPAAPKMDDEKKQTSSTLSFAFGLPTSKGFSFGLPPSSTNEEASSTATSKPVFGVQNQQISLIGTAPTKPSDNSADKSPPGKPGLFSLTTTTQASSSLFGAINAASTTTKSIFGVTTNTVKTSEQQAPLAATKTEGQWDCSSCYTTNESTDTKCPCCGEANPSAPTLTKAGTGSNLGSFCFPQPQSADQFSFGISPKPASDDTQDAQNVVKPAGSVISPPKFAFGKSSSSAFSFGRPQSNNSEKSAFGTGQQKTANVFANFGSNVTSQSNDSENITFGIGQQQTSNVFAKLSQHDEHSTGKELPKPRFPSVGEEEADDSDEYTDDDSSYETSEYDDEDEEYEQQRESNRSEFRSPLNRQPEVSSQNNDDVVHVGEILPSEELQKKAENLMLPKHFYNFVKEGDDNGSQGSETGDEQTITSDKGSMDNKVASSANETIGTTTTSTTFGFASAAGASFADIVKTNTNTTGFAFGATNTGWVGMSAQKPLFANLTETKTNSPQDEEEYYQTEDNNDIHFEPIANLPEKVDLVTGEEGEETLYSDRCKLYRFNKPTNEWKERGVGDIKLQKSVKTGRIRIVMRREQVLKVCANHYIRPGMALEGSKTSDRAWTWTALDFTEEEPQMEVFTARFKNSEAAKAFKEKFDLCQMMLLDADPMTPCKASSLRTEELSNKAEKMKNELRYFKDKFSEPSKIDLENTITDEAGPSEPRSSSSVGPLTPLVVQHAQSRKASSEKSSGSIMPETPRKHTTSTGSDDPQAEIDVHFEPIIRLPDKVDLTTGEEDEQVIFGNRGKLFAYHKETKQWKERGVGDVKILQNLTTFKVRVMMRREQVFKVCLNHFLQPEITLSFKEKNSSRTLLWSAKDFSDTDKPDGEALQFALRLNDPATANSFKQLWEDGVEAAVAKILLDPDPSLINTSALRSGVTSPGPVIKSPTSPESPVKQAPFSFANVPSPFDMSKKADNLGPVNVMGFVFGKTPDKSDKSSTPSNEKFKFDVSNLSFAFGSTSTPQMATSGTSTTAFFTPPQNITSTKSIASKSLFSGESSDSGADSNLYLTSSETFTQPDQSTGDQDQNSAVQPKQKEVPKPVQAAAAKGYTPSPLVASHSSGTVKPFSVQSGSKFQFKPVISESSQKTTNDLTGQNADDDVIFVSELIPTEDQRRRAEKLLLPPTFFLFENKTMPEDFNEKSEEEKEDKILKYIEERDYGKVEDDKSVKGPDLGEKATSKEEQATQSTPDQNLKSLSEKTTQPVQEQSTQPDSDKTGEDAISKEEQATQSTPDQNSESLSGQTTQPVQEQSTQPDSDKTGESASDDLQQNLSEDKWVFGGELKSLSASDGFASFAAMSSGVQNIGFKKDPGFQFPGKGQVMFQSQAAEETDESDPASYKCEAQFKPVLDEPPPLIEVKTGEEGEEVLFKERCTLFRYDKETKQWKERGRGDIKILRNDQHNIYRVVMRREQIFKVCANHIINATTKPEPHLGSVKTCSYFAMDYTESTTPTGERFAVRFKTEELCKTYTDTIEEIKEIQNSQL